MKNTINLTFLFSIMLLIYSCGPCEKCANTPQDEVTLHPQDAIPLTQFQDWVHNWDSLGQTYTASTLTQYFTLPLVDMTEFTANMDTTGVDSVRVVAARFYLGLDLTGAAPQPHIMLVGVNALGDSLTNSTQDQYIYDVSKPCPTLCGEDSLPNKK